MMESFWRAANRAVLIGLGISVLWLIALALRYQRLWLLVPAAINLALGAWNARIWGDSRRG
jgi:hypothetical protein